MISTPLSPFISVSIILRKLFIYVDHRKGVKTHMPRPRKDGERVSLFLNREMMERLRAFADERGQTLTTAMERIITAYLDEIDKKQDHQ